MENTKLNILISVILSSIAVYVAANILPGVHISSFWTALIVAVVLGIINSYIRTFIFLITLPINILTLGLFTFVIIGGIVMFVTYIVPGFKVDSFWWALAFAFVVAIFNSFLQTFNRQGIR